MAGRERRDVWASGDAYEPYVGRWSRAVARAFLAWLAVPPGGAWLDVGCGTGALTQSILAVGAPSAVLGVDRSEGFASYADARTADARAWFAVGDAAALPARPSRFDAAVSGLVLNFVPDPGAAVAGMARAARAGGAVAAYVWDYAEGMGLMRRFWDAAGDLDPAARELDEGRRFPLCHPGPLRELFDGAGLGGVDTRAIEVPTVFRDFDDYWGPFLGGQGPAPGYVASLDEAGRARLRERLRAALPARADGTIHLTARAWAVRGVAEG
jgi:SAM-dependent methyltransferase